MVFARFLEKFIDENIVDYWKEDNLCNQIAKAIKEKNALVTGGANGIGKSISEGLANEGVNVFFTSRSQKTIREMESALKKYNTKCKGIKVDFLIKNSLNNFLNQIKKLS